MSPARAQTQTARSGVEHTNHEVTAPPTIISSHLKGLLKLKLKDVFSHGAHSVILSRQALYTTRLPVIALDLVLILPIGASQCTGTQVIILYSESNNPETEDPEVIPITGPPT